HFAVAPIRSSKDAIKRVRIRTLDLAHGSGKRRAHVGGRFADVPPVATFGDLEAVFVRELLAVLLDHPLVLFIPDIRKAFEEEERQNVVLPIRPIDGASAKDLGAVPEVRL